MRRNFDPANRATLEADLFRLRRDGLTFEQISALAGWPTRPTLRKWMREHPQLADSAAHGRDEFHKWGQRYPFDAEAARRLVQRVRLGYPIGDLIREPGMPHRRALTAWKQRDPAFAADLAAATAFADGNRRRSGATARRVRRSRWPYDEAVADRIILALIRGATLPALGRDPSLPSGLGLERWRKAHPVFDVAVRKALKAGHRARGKARTDAHASPALVAEIERRIAAGASLHSLSKAPDMPSAHSLYKWTRERPDLAEAVAYASAHRDAMYADQAHHLLQTHGLAAEREVRAIFKRLGQLNPGRGRKRRKA